MFLHILFRYSQTTHKLVIPLHPLHVSPYFLHIVRHTTLTKNIPSHTHRRSLYYFLHYTLYGHNYYLIYLRRVSYNFLLPYTKFVLSSWFSTILCILILTFHRRNLGPKLALSTVTNIGTFHGRNLGPKLALSTVTNIGTFYGRNLGPKLGLYK